MSMRVAPVYEEMPRASGNFVGREEYLKKLKEQFGIIESDSMDDSKRKTYLLHGLGGIGKSQIAMKFKDDTRRHWSRIFWVDATSEESIEQSLNKIYTINIGFKTSSYFSTDSVLNWIADLDSGWLLVLDNADQSLEIINRYIPPGDRGSILITSRNPALNAVSSPQNSSEVTKLSEDDSVTLLLKTIGLNPNASQHREIAKEIVAQVSYLPLAINHIGLYIRAGKCRINSFLETFKEDRVQILDDETITGRSVYDYWETSFQKIVDIARFDLDEDMAAAASHAMRILNMGAFFHHEKVPQEMFERAAVYYQFKRTENSRLPTLLGTLKPELFCESECGAYNEQLFTQSLELLASYSLIQVNGDSFSLHPLVQMWCKDRLSLDDQQRWILNGRGIITASISEEEDSNTAQEMMYLISLSRHIVENTYHGKSADITTYYDDSTKAFANILRINGQYHLAEELFTEIMNTYHRTLGPNHRTTINSMINLASIYLHESKWAEAEKLQKAAKMICARFLGKEHPDTLRNLADLASCYSYQGKWSDAELLQLQILAMRTKMYGSDHPNTISMSSKLAETYLQQGKWAEAEKLELQIVEKKTRTLGSEHPSTLHSMSNLATVYVQLGKSEDAEKLQEHVVRGRIKILGEEHPDTLTSMENISVAYMSKGKLTDALRLQKRVLELRTKVMGAEHPHTLNIMTNLAGTYRKQGNWADTESIETRVLHLSTGVLGREHPDTVRAMENLSATYGNQGKWLDAEELQKQVVKIRMDTMGEDHPDTIASMVKLMETLKVNGKWAEPDMDMSDY